YVHFRNNIFQTTGGVPLLKVTSGQISGSIDLRFENNDYYSTGAAWKVLWGASTYTSLTSFRVTGQEKRNGANVGTSVNPMLAAPGTGQTFNNANNLHLLTAYKLQAASPLKNVAWNLKTMFAIDMGTRDYIGTTTPQSGAYDFGACEYV
ncbi:MAG: beta-glucosidase, partial [Tepidisphaeraceae bacterium]